jgi:hypothetical protein
MLISKNKKILTAAIFALFFSFSLPISVQAQDCASDESCTLQEMQDQLDQKKWANEFNSIKIGENKGIDAVKGPLNNIAEDTGLSQNTDLTSMLGQIINYLFGLVGTLFILIVLVGGFKWMMAGGSEEKVGAAKGWIVNGVNGMIVIFLAYALVNTILLALKAASAN